MTDFSQCLCRQFNGQNGRYYAIRRRNLAGIQSRILVGQTSRFPTRVIVSSSTGQSSTSSSDVEKGWQSSVDEDLTESEAVLSDFEYDHQNRTGQTSFQLFLLELPFRLFATYAHVTGRWLRRRRRSHWWSKSAFPWVPCDRVEIKSRPIQQWQKLLGLGSVFFCSTFILTLIQNLRDALVVTCAGAEALPFLAACILPASVLYFTFYGQLVDILHDTPQNIFYYAIAPLIGFFTLFGFVLYPAASTLHPHQFIQSVSSFVPGGLMGALKCVEYWTLSLFYIMSELWGTVVISLLFWSLANEVCTVEDARSIYPLLGIAANVALVVAGKLLGQIAAMYPTGDMVSTVALLTGIVVVASTVMFGLKWMVDNFLVHSEDRKLPKKKKKKGGLMQSLQLLRNSPKSMYLGTLVVSYSLAHRLFEFAWKSSLRSFFSTPAQYSALLADVSVATGTATITLMLLGKFVFEKLGWGWAAAAPPVVMMLSGCAFFCLQLFSPSCSPQIAGMSYALFAGLITQVFAKSCKFSLFDPAKEMVYITMSKEEKSKGKAAIDVVGSQFGKSGSAWATQGILLATGSLVNAFPMIFAMYAGVLVSWLSAVFQLEQLVEHEPQAKKVAVPVSSSEPEKVNGKVNVGLSDGISLNKVNGYQVELGMNGNGHMVQHNVASNGNGNGHKSERKIVGILINEDELPPAQTSAYSTS
eukprot:TRINITY_DN3186_c0_g1_i1.p1 TRINITY_DN3186_c0_g1~~TRINITY_DN3186_c0_g1_i1.p1  ORF type:complete len:698 (+),score=78.50 TRINITY_DN3186_c0_g1_i1:139-2232(+)